MSLDIPAQKIRTIIKYIPTNIAEFTCVNDYL